MSFHDWYWLVWLGGIFLAFEVYAAWKTPAKADTFSEWVWRVFGVGRRFARYGRLRRFILVGFMVSLTAHFVLAATVLPVIVFGVGVAWAVCYHFVRERRRRG